MQNWILSKELECWKADGINCLRRSIILLGIREEYFNCGTKLTFKSWYKEYKDKNEYHFINVAIRNISKRLEHKYTGLHGHKYHIYKSIIRRYVRTRQGHRVIVYEGTFIVYDQVLRMIYEDEDMKRIYEKEIKCDTYKEYLGFQADCLDEFIGAAESLRQQFYSEQVRGRFIRSIEG